jgi:hypothetical protein
VDISQKRLSQLTAHGGGELPGRAWWQFLHPRQQNPATFHAGSLGRGRGFDKDFI